jgi:hypothetical protein
VSQIFNLREVCRQIRGETDPLSPYRCTIFSFLGPFSLESFADSLTIEQRGAVENVCLPQLKLFLRGQEEYYGRPWGLRKYFRGTKRILVEAGFRVTILDGHCWIPRRMARLFNPGVDSTVPIEIKYVDLFDKLPIIEGASGFVIAAGQNLEGGDMQLYVSACLA